MSTQRRAGSVRDWSEWHDAYRDPASDLSARLRVVQELLRDRADKQGPGPLRLVSICAGQGDDVIGVLGEHPRRDDVVGLLVELDPRNVAAAAAGLERAGLHGLRAVVADAGTTTPYETAVPADLVLACGVFGNTSDADVRRTVSTLPRLCAPGATVVWTRHRREPDLTPAIRAWFGEAGFEEVAFVSPGADRFSVGAHRLAADPPVYEAGLPLFTFRR